MSCGDDLQWAARKSAQAFPARPRTQNKIIGSDRMIGPKAPQVIPKFPGATSADPQMMNGRHWLVIDPETGTPESMREFRLEIIGYTHEPFVKPPEPQHYIATYRKIPAHKVLDPGRLNRSEVKAAII
jgi:hypothetical protein